MVSATAVTYELDDIPAAAEELVSQIRSKLELKKESIGILHAQPEIELDTLSALLHEKLGFSIVGGTTAAASTLDNCGLQEFALLLHVLTADDCVFSAALSDSMENEPQKQIADTYNRAYAELINKNAGDEPKVVFCITSNVHGYPTDEGLTVLTGICGGLPVAGYVAADDFDFSKQQVFMNGRTGGDLMALILISGNVKPVIVVKNLAGSRTFERKRVTKAHDNIICEIDGMPAFEYIKSFPFFVPQTDLLWNYQFFVEMQNELDHDGMSVSRALHSFNEKTGEISSLASIPQDSYISFQYCNDADVKNSCASAVSEVMDKINDSSDDYQYSTVLIASCSLRGLFLADNKSAEGDLIKEMAPSGLTVSGLYAFGEIGPTSIKDSKAVNRFHHATMTICAL